MRRIIVRACDMKVSCNISIAMFSTVYFFRSLLLELSQVPSVEIIKMCTRNCFVVSEPPVHIVEEISVWR
jgi:hypothetical protein